MCPLEEAPKSSCCGRQRQHPYGILYSILSGRKARRLHCGTVAAACRAGRRAVCLRDPETTCRDASDVLAKTVRFLRGLPSFRQLPRGDQLSLLGHSWVPVFVLGLAQDKIFFEVTDSPHSSLLRKILLGPGLTSKETRQATLRDVRELRTCLRQLWNLELSAKEYAYLKGALLFDPGKTRELQGLHDEVLKGLGDDAPRSVPAAEGLDASSSVEGLRREACHALQELIRRLYADDPARFGRILRAAAAVQTLSHSLVAELFFGNTNMMHFLKEMLFT